MNTDTAPRGADPLRDFDRFAQWLESAHVLDAERAPAMRAAPSSSRPAPSPCSIDARACAPCCARSPSVAHARRRAHRRAQRRSIACSVAAPARAASRCAPRWHFIRSFVPVGDAFAGLVIPIVDGAADALILDELPRVRRCADPRCRRVFLDTTKNGRRRWCDMSTCGNRAKAARHRMKLHA